MGESKVPAVIEDRRVDQIVAQIQELKRTLQRQTVEQLARIGERLRDLKHVLKEERQWLWTLRHRLHIGHTAANGYIKLYEWSKTKPALFDQLKGLGVGKARPLLDAPWSRASKIVNRKTFQLDGWEKPVTLEDMTDRQFGRVLDRYVPATERQDPSGVLYGLLFRLRRLRDRVEEAGRMSPRARAKARQALKAEVAQFETALSRLKSSL